MTFTDVTGIDANLNAIDRVQAAWQLPQIPDQTKLDLASQTGVSPASVSAFLSGIGQSVRNSVNPLVPRPVLNTPQNPSILYSPSAASNPYADLGAIAHPHQTATQAAAPGIVPVYPQVHTPDAIDSFRSVLAGVEGNPAPSIPDEKAVVTIKQQAKQMGLLPADFPIDGTWSSEMNTVFNQMQTQQFMRRSQGHRPGAFSFSSLVDKANEWLSPSFLLHTATKMKFLPDFNDVAHEFADWPDKWSRFQKTGSVHDLLDALTGPIDDIAVPLVNTGMLLSGVGEVYTFARMGEMSADAINAASWADKAKSLLVPLKYSGEMAAADRAAFAEPGFLARRLAGTAVGDSMDAWRNLSAVQDAKKVFQVGMRLGQTGLLEANLFPHAGYTQPIVKLREYRSQNPQAYMLGDMFLDRAFVPTSIWPKGFFMDPVKAPMTFFKGKLSEIGKEARVTDEVARGTLSGLQQSDPTAAANFEQTLKTHGPSAALIEYHGGGEEGAQKAGLHTLWNSIVTAIDGEAVKTANLAQPDKSLDPANWWRTFYLGRTKKLAELKDWDPGNLDDYLDYIKNTQGSKAYMKVLAKAQDPAQRDQLLYEFGKAAEAHNANRPGVAGLLLDQITPGMVQQHMQNQFTNPNGWDQFTAATSDMQSWIAQGAKPEAGTISKVAKVTNPEWERALALQTRLRDAPDTLDKPLLEQELQAEMSRLKGVPQTITVQNEEPIELRYAQVKSDANRNLAVRPKGDGLDLSKYIAPGLREEPTSVSWNGNFNPLVKGIDPSRTGWALMRDDSATKQDAIRLLNETKGYFKRRDAALWLDQNREHAGLIYLELNKALQEQGGTTLGNLGDSAGEADTAAGLSSLAPGSGISELDPRLALSRIRDAYGPMATKNVERGTQLLQWMDKNGVGIDDVVKATQDDLTAQGRNAAWGEKFGLAAHLSTDEKYAALKRLQNWMAAEVSGAPKTLTDSLAARGYKLAHGSGAFLMPGDLTGLVSPFKEVTQQQMRQMTLGSFIWGVGDDGADVNKIVGTLRQNRFKDSLVERLARLRDAGNLGTDMPLQISADSPDVDNILSLIRGRKSDLVDNAQKGLDEAAGAFNKTVERLHAAWAPSRIQDLSRHDVRSALSPIYGDNVATEAYKALKDSFWLGDDTMKYRGLAGVEDYLRANSLAALPLKLLSQTASGARIAEAGKENFALSSRLLAGAAGAGAGYEAGNQQGDGNSARMGALAGLVGGLTVGPGAAKRALNLVQDSNWDIYTRLPDPLMRLSQVLRFTLSPMFDVERSIKGSILSQTAELPEGTSLPFRVGKGAFIKKYGEDAWNTAKAQFSAVSSGAEGPDIEWADNASRIFRQEGILGFSPVHQQVATFGHLTQQGVDPEQAYNIAHKIFTYGNRSPLEQSANFLFFPFSFEKKLYTNVARFMSDDMGRALAIHDGLRLYDAANERYDLSDYLKTHLPVARDLEKLNAFAYGASPGELGGIHRPWLNFFTPIITTKKFDANKLAKRLIPAYRDINYLVDDLQQQGHVVFGADHLTTQAEAEKGWSALRQWKQLADQEAQRRGYQSWAQSSRDAGMADVADKYKTFKAQLFNKYPAFEVSLGDAIARQQDNAIEIQRRTLDPKTPEDRMLQFFSQQQEAVKAAASANGFSFDTAPEDVPEQYFQLMRNTALSLGPAFLPTYNHFFRKVYGPVESQLA